MKAAYWDTVEYYVFVRMVMAQKRGDEHLIWLFANEWIHW